MGTPTLIPKNFTFMTFTDPAPGTPSEGHSPAAQARSTSKAAKRYPLIVLCLLLGPLGMMYLDWKNGFLGLLTLALYWVGTFLAWPPLMVIFLMVGLPLCAYRAHRWINGEVDLYKKVFCSGFKSVFDSLPLFLPLLFDLYMLVLLENLLRQAWLNRQRGSVMAALTVAFVSTPILMIGVRAMGKAFLNKALRPYRIERNTINRNQ